LTGVGSITISVNSGVFRDRLEPVEAGRSSGTEPFLGGFMTSLETFVTSLETFVTSHDVLKPVAFGTSALLLQVIQVSLILDDGLTVGDGMNRSPERPDVPELVDLVDNVDLCDPPLMGPDRRLSGLWGSGKIDRFITCM